MRPSGSNLINLTADSEADEFGPSWRPDGHKLAFMSNRVAATNPEGDFEIFVMNANGSGVRQLTANTLDDEFPNWSPDGRKLVFQRDFDPVVGQVDYDLFTMKADGTHQRNLTRSPGINDQDADWSPDGRRIAFASERDGDLEVYTMRPDGSRIRQLTTNDGPFDGFRTGRRTAARSLSRPTATRTSRSTRCAPTAAGRSIGLDTRGSTSSLTGSHSRNGTIEEATGQPAQRQLQHQ